LGSRLEAIPTSRTIRGYGARLVRLGASEVTAQWKRLYAVLDADAAGQEAAAQLLEALASRLIPVALPPSTKDPAELGPWPDGSVLFRAAIRQAVACYSALCRRDA
jgi:DNA primase